MKLESVYRHGNSAAVLYRLLEERTPEQSISHKKMPEYKQHLDFVESRPYRAWYLCLIDKVPVGAVYLTLQREIGVFIFKAEQGKGYGEQAVKMLMEKWPGRFLANVNPQNKASMAMFTKLGFNLIQNTYELS
jgi:RimJ/RimL family protein N-acetyltransferase